MTDEPVLDVTDGVARVELNRPDKLQRAERRPGQTPVGGGRDGRARSRRPLRRVVGRRRCVLCGRRHRPDEGPSRTERHAARNAARSPVSGQRYGRASVLLEKPVIVKVDGVAMGGGANLALAGDLVFAATDATFGEVFKNVGLSVDFGGSFLLPQLVGLPQSQGTRVLRRTDFGRRGGRHRTY